MPRMLFALVGGSEHTWAEAIAPSTDGPLTGQVSSQQPASQPVTVGITLVV